MKDHAAQEFFIQQLQSIGLSEPPKFRVYNPRAEPPMPKSQEISLFTQDDKGNLVIPFFRLNRHLIPVHIPTGSKSGNLNAKVQYWQQKRLIAPKSGYKYENPKGHGTWPYLPPAVIEAYEREAEIPTLFITEGAKKALCSTINGIQCVGLTSITTYRDPETKGLHTDVLEFMKTAKTERLVILFDGDCRDIKLDTLEAPLEDASKRPAGFFAAVAGIRKLAIEAGIRRVAFMHVKSQALPTIPKGLDDLIINAKAAGILELVLEELRAPETAKRFFSYQDITSSTGPLRNYFGLGSADAFYELHAELIGDKEFIFGEDVYKYDEERGVLELLREGWTKNVVWIGDDFFEILRKPQFDGSTKEALYPRNRETLKLRYGKDFHKKIMRYDGMECFPAHIDYQESVGGWFNIYRRLEYKPAPGPCDNILEMIKHLFGDEAIEHNGKTIYSYELGLDYLQLLYERPTQKLPIIILYSPEQGTGKSTFLLLLYMLFGENYYPANSQDFRSDFTEMFAGRLVVGVDEALLDKDADKELIKKLSLAPAMSINPKGRRQYTVTNHMKIAFCTNKSNSIRIEPSDNRFWIIRVPELKVKDDFLKEKMSEEIPSFLHFLENRQLVSEHVSRMWFDQKLYIREAFAEFVSVNEPAIVKELREQFEELFNAQPGVDEIRVPAKEIREHILERRFELNYIRRVLKEYFGVDKQAKSERGIFKCIISARYEEGYKSELREVYWNGQPFVLKRHQFVKDAPQGD